MIRDRESVCATQLLSQYLQPAFEGLNSLCRTLDPALMYCRFPAVITEPLRGCPGVPIHPTSRRSKISASRCGCMGKLPPGSIMSLFITRSERNPIGSVS